MADAGLADQPAAPAGPVPAGRRSPCQRAHVAARGVRRGTNETTKSIERGNTKLVIIAENVEPPEVVAHLPILCEERNTPYIFVPSKEQLGASLGMDVGSAAATILDPGEAQTIVEQVLNSIQPLRDKRKE